MQEATDSSKKSMYASERRQNARYPIPGVARFQWRLTDGQWREGRGVTCDISKRGVFIAAEELPAVAAPLRMEVTLPVGWQRDAELRLYGSGSVRHTRLNSASYGYGAFVVFHVRFPAGGGRGNARLDEVSLSTGQVATE